MIVPSSNMNKHPSAAARFARSAILFAFGAVILWVFYVYAQVHENAGVNLTPKSDAIAVFGAAEYDGRPSPVLRARLDHALDLYNDGVAPLIVTLGGGGGDATHSEGGVGHDYLLAHGVPENKIIAETQSSDTAESAARLATIAHANQLRRIVVVSDRTHMFRIKELCASEGLEVYGSPRPDTREVSLTERVQRYAHEIVSYTAWKLHLHW